MFDYIYKTTNNINGKVEDNMGKKSIVVIEGPLKGIEGNIIKVDKRKQRAKIRVEFAGTAHTMDLSFEDIERKG